MWYHYEKPTIYASMYGETYIRNHQVYSRCTLYKIGSRGLVIIQQRFYHKNKQTWWSEIDPWLTDSLYLDPKFKAFFDRRAKDPVNNLYPTVTIRQNMWALKLKKRYLISRKKHSPLWKPNKNLKEDFIMFDFIMLVVAFYIAIVATNITILAIVMSKWFRKKFINMSKEIAEEFEEMF